MKKYILMKKYTAFWNPLTEHICFTIFLFQFPPTVMHKFTPVTFKLHINVKMQVTVLWSFIYRLLFEKRKYE